MLFMVIERFKQSDLCAVGERFQKRGRMLPEGVVYHASWIDPASARCFQLMEAAGIEAFTPWIDRWSDLAEFEVIPVVESVEYWTEVFGTRSE